MTLMVRIYEEQTALVSSVVAAWKVPSADPVGFQRDVDGLIAECESLAEKARSIIADTVPAAYGGNYPDCNDMGKHVLTALDALRATGGKLNDFVLAAFAAGSEERLVRVAALQKRLDAVRETFVRHWPWLDAEALVSADKAFAAGHSRNLKDLMHAL